ncbi:MAG TPA: hypothetical protein VN841_14460 [Bryobacteraceae bacterium]|nr:hypothetical protein [Bryobacteraceae bacterium]
MNLRAAPLTCAASALPQLSRAEGLTEPVADYVLECTGGTPTPANAPVPQVNITLFLNTNITSKVTALSEFSEALLLVDEPNTANNGAQRRLLNCGQTGAPDLGPSGPGVCEIISTGNPAQTYDGSIWTFGTGLCGQTAATFVPNPKYGCGRPNAFQARLEKTFGPGQDNAITFEGVPLDPPGSGKRVLRITNVRGDSDLLGGGGSISGTVHVEGSTFVSISNPTQILSFNVPGMTASVPAMGKIRVIEGFASSWKDRNVAFTVGNSAQPMAGNATYPPAPWTYTPGSTNYPDQVAQNVPGTLYNTEDLFQYQPAAINGPPTVNPPPLFGIGPVANIGYPLNSGLYAANTGIDLAGVSSQGTRVALYFTGLPTGVTVKCATQVFLDHAGTTTPSTGVLVMTATDAAGAGPFTAVSGGLGSSNTNLAVYEVLYADPFAIEFADIPCNLVSPNASQPPLKVTAKASLAPFYTVPGADRPTPTSANPTPTALPRFDEDSTTVTVTLTSLELQPQ